jgi:hypothetical protein
MKKQNFSVLNYGSTEIPLFAEKQGQEWVDYGIDNLYGEYLRDLFLSSSTHGAIVNGVADMIYGGGLEATDREDNDQKKEQWIRLQELLNNSDDSLLQKMAFDIKLYGMVYLNVIWNRARTRIGAIKHLPVHTMRSGIADSDGVVSHYYYKYDWNNRREENKVLNAFSMDDRTEASTCYQIKRYSVAQHFYAVPDYVGSTNYIELDREVSTFHLNNIRRGFFPSMLLSFKNGVPTEQERVHIEQKVVEKFTGADNAGRILITFNDGDETAPEFTPIETNGADTMYEFLSKTVSEKILTGHRVVSPLLFGVRGGEGFGSNADEIRDSYSLFNNTVIAPFQDILLKALGGLFAVNDIELDIYFITAKPADFLDLDVIETLDEGEQEKEGANADEFSHQCFSDLPQKTQVKLADALIKLGEDEEDILKDYEKIDTREASEESEPIMDALFTFASVIRSTGNDGKGKSEQDNELIKIRYRYAPDKSTHKPQRDFCSDMISAGKVYTKENIIAGFGANPGFGIDGGATYDIWLYKGGPNCFHWFERVTYLQKDNKKISINEARRLITSLPPNERDAVRIPTNDRKVAQRPRDMPNNGYYN